MNEKSPLMIVVPAEGHAEFVSHVAEALGQSAPHTVFGDPQMAIAGLSKRAESPRYLVIDIGEQGNETLADIDAMAEYCDAQTRVVVIGSVNDVHFYRALKSRGVVEYFPRPVKIDDIRMALLSSEAEEKATDGKVMTFMSAASGDGASTLALNTAYTLAADYKKSVVLVDMDYQFGMIAKNLDLTAPFGIKELFEHPDRGIDDALIKRMTVTYGSGSHRLEIIAAPNQLHALPEVRVEAVRDLIAVLRRSYDVVILDLPHVWTPWVASAVTNATHAVMTAQLWLRSATHSARLLSVWRKMSVNNRQITLVVNRSGAKFKEAVSARDFERICGLSVRYYFLNDIKSVMIAENQGKTLLESGNSALSRQFKEFASYFSKEWPSDNGGESGKSSVKSSLLK